MIGLALILVVLVVALRLWQAEWKPQGETDLRFRQVDLSGLWIFQILKNRSSYPKWMALFSPALVLGVIITVSMAAPKLGGLLIPNAMNVAHIIVFSLSLWSGRYSDHQHS